MIQKYFIAIVPPQPLLSEIQEVKKKYGKGKHRR